MRVEEAGNLKGKLMRHLKLCAGKSAREIPRCIRNDAQETGERTEGMWKSWLVHDLEAVFLDDRIGEDLLGDFLQLLLGFVARPAVEIEDEKFALAYVGNGSVAEPGKCVLDGLTLRIENGALRHDPNVSFHEESIAGARSFGRDGTKDTQAQSGQATRTERRV